MKKSILLLAMAIVLGLLSEASASVLITFDQQPLPLGGREYYASSYYYPTTRPNYYYEGEYTDLTSWIPVIEGNFPAVPGNYFPEIINGGMGHIILGEDWHDLTGVLFRYPPCLIDNIHCQPPAVPIPPSVLLLGSGLVSFVAVKRKFK